MKLPALFRHFARRAPDRRVRKCGNPTSMTARGPAHQNRH
ncbi:hypothetical protein L838_2093 [Mycobacterium avium MAV_120709_2344]|nr:hypothetical protein L839_1887 [Mycobacterium avium MAV_120809_2495]ETZ49970.1 hypothetical protein L837_0730 [Mycobacterium avium MAV_061107_1842]ETZ53612.1 hypothetical protein L838_2093 [Mycobacterium avium MAV_120709_2344]ETZ56704.1 hypothetical protein L840_3669 [Mycobacterium sp. MAC_011194_8550]ETZ66687.1 hypothetical protein L841_3610 [Mycobacterium sp. MAC_080597_8934]